MKLPSQLSKFDYAVYAISLCLCFLLFKQSDLTHTNSSSFAFLYGHFWDFYDYNKSRMGDNNYLPIFYWFFALWNIPLKLLGLLPEVTGETWMLATPIQTIWSKLLLAVFFFCSVSLVGKISEQISATALPNKINQDGLPPRYLFATSPIAIFAVFIFSGYDIFAVFFMLLGVRAYFAKNFNWFALWFSVAISFKYFAVLIYLPLVLLIEKRLIYLVLYGLLGVSITAIQFALYWHSDIFLGEIFGLVSAKATGHAVSIRFVIANIAYGAMCLYLYFSKLDITADPQAWYRRTIFACILSYALFFSWVLWHPQWIILITPFICLSYSFTRNQKTMLCIEILGYLGFAIYCMNNWVGNVDNTMIYGGVFGGILPQMHTLASDVIGHKWMALSRTLFYGLLYAPLLMMVLERFDPMIARKSDGSKLGFWAIGLSSERTLFDIRFLVATYFYILVTAVCLYRG
ncbi:hypothetical protein A9236_06800 [Polynucleobacter sp. QLW-P1DATA-2]|uniref:hypothetical protein n=1 Tax=unclassified Polynucleobacter TaxID=2640945 RepID=UPI0008F8C613|nr:MULTISPECIES: hypothetical protein [unclassified Polynucleobacter]OIN00894.1 hypothetical protein A9236_06800 [Polynucleobacter sp. QLW-P1DATA-2]OIN02461.1 hypothetical protein A9235_01880 [Polynucleobacter sp. MWH-Tro8-2-5-gr]